MLLTGQRSGEVLGALTRANLMRDGMRWRIPLGYFKSSKHHTQDHIVHLSPQAQYAIDIAWHRDDPAREAVFVERPQANGKKLVQGVASVRGLANAVRSMLQAGSDATKVQAAKQKHKAAAPGVLHPMKQWTPHDLRRTFATGLGELGVLPHIIEKCLNHKLEGILATYQRGDHMAEREAAFLLWGRTIDALLARRDMPDAEMGWSDLRDQPSAQIISLTPRSA